MSLGERRKARQKITIPQPDYEDVPMQNLGAVHHHQEQAADVSFASAASGSPLLQQRRRRGSSSAEVTWDNNVVNLLPSHTMAPLTPAVGSPGWFQTQRFQRQRSRATLVDGGGGCSRLGSSGFLTLRKPVSREEVDDYAAEIVDVLQQDEQLMADSPESEEKRLMTLREMPEALGLKRSVRARLSRTVSLNSEGKAPPGASKLFRYRVRAALAKMRSGARKTVSGMQFWGRDITLIEGTFGSGVATYFRFLRSLLLLDCTVLIISLGFLVTPQLLDRYYEVYNTTESWSYRPRPHPYGNNSNFKFGNLLTGDGWLRGTELFYGAYSNSSISLSDGHVYNIASAYFCTTLVCFVLSITYLGIGMARSYRKNFIELHGGLTNEYAHKLFCGWDFRIVNAEAAALRSQSLFNELRELLHEEAQTEAREAEKLKWRRYARLGARAGVTLFVVSMLVGSGALVWYLLFKQEDLLGGDNGGGQLQAAMMMSAVVTCVMLVLPMIFSRLSALEEYRNPRTAVFATLLRTFGLEVAIIGVLLAFWLSSGALQSSCWETSLGQEVYRLIIADFFICLIGTSLGEFVRSRLHKTLWPGIGAPQFDIARNTLNLIYNQTLFWVGFFFGPLLAAVIVLKLVITFYVKKVSVRFSCQPSARSWRAAQTHTVFLALTFLAAVGVIVTVGYVITQVEVSQECGPFRDHTFIYEKIREDMLHLSETSVVWTILVFFTKPGVVAFIIVALCVLVYYMRAVARARGSMVKLLRNLLKLEAEDKLFLQSSIREAVTGRWSHKQVQRGSYLEDLILASRKTADL